MEKLLPWGIGATVLALVWFANRSSNGPSAGTGPAPAPMVEWIMQKAIHLDRNDAQALWLVTVRHVPDGETGGVNNRLLMLSLAWQESAWRFDVTGDDGKSVGLYQMQESALEDVRRFWKSSFPV